MKVSWVTIDRFCQEKTEVNEDIRHDLERNGKPLRASAESLSDDELLTKLRDLGVDGDRDGVERLCADALSAEEAARPILDKLRLGDDLAGDWVWICLLALWERWWPDRVCMELLDDKMQPRGSVSRRGACGKGRPAHPPGRRRHPGYRANSKSGRNSPCPCGSEKKFKKCCGSPLIR